MDRSDEFDCNRSRKGKLNEGCKEWVEKLKKACDKETVVRTGRRRRSRGRISRPKNQLRKNRNDQGKEAVCQNRMRCNWRGRETGTP